MAIEGIVSKLNAEAIAKAAEKTEGKLEGAKSERSFNDILNDKVSEGLEFAEMLGMDTNRLGGKSTMDTLSGTSVDFKPDEAATLLKESDGERRLLHLVNEVNHGHQQMTSLVDQVLHGGPFTSQELLVMQAYVFHYAQMSELTVKVAEQGVSSVKAVLNTQIQ